MGRGFVLFLLALSIVGSLAGNLRFMPDSNGHKGRAEVYRGGAWGSVCDLWFEVLGWPNLFCSDLGFPGAVAANYTNNPLIGIPGDWDRYVVPSNDYPISMINPRCKLSDGINFMSCDRHPFDCTHAQDVYVECLSKMKCDRERTRFGTSNKQTTWVTRCVPMIYKDGEWGYVSESRDLSSFEDNQSTWMSAFCKEIGFENVKDVKNGYTNGLVKDTLPVLRCDPECLDDNPQNIDNCPSGPSTAENCKHEYVPYITCEIQRLTNYLEILETERQAKVAEKDAIRAEKEARRAKRQAVKMVEQAAKAVKDKSEKDVKVAIKNARKSVAKAEKAAREAEKDTRDIERDLAKFETASLREAEKIAKKAAENARKLANRAEKITDRIEKQAAKAFKKTSRLDPGTPEYEAALEEALKLMEEAEAASIAAIETAGKALAEAEDIAAAAEKHSKKEIRKAEKKAERDVKNAIKEVEKAERKAAAATIKAERLSSKLEDNVTKAVNKATEKAAKFVAEAEEKVKNAEKKADNLREEADNMTKERYDQDGNIIPF